MKKYLVGLASLASLALASSAMAATVVNGNAAELGLHRVERLVLQKKAEAGFLTHLQGLSVEALAHQSNDADPAFKVVAYQFAAADSTRRHIEMTLNQAGKPLVVEVKDGGEPVGFPTFPDKDALTLFEGAIHYLMHKAETDEKLKPYAEKLTQMSISSGKNGQNQDVAVVEILAGNEGPMLKIFVKFDGTVDSVAFVQR